MGVRSEQTVWGARRGGQLFPSSLSLSNGRGLHRQCSPPTLCLLFPPNEVFLVAGGGGIWCLGALWVGGVIVSPVGRTGVK